MPPLTPSSVLRPRLARFSVSAAVQQRPRIRLSHPAPAKANAIAKTFTTSSFKFFSPQKPTLESKSSLNPHVPRPPPPPQQQQQQQQQQQTERTAPAPKPSYEMTFTCTPCGARSTHLISKQGYHHGSVLATCPGCRNRHVVSDHLGIFGDTNLTIEDLMREQGQLVKKGTLSEDGDLEFWADGSTTERAKTRGAPKAEGSD